MNIKKIWKNKWKILEALWYNHVIFRLDKLHWAKKQVEDRRIQCYLCPKLDREGQGDNVILKGHPSCSFCGCNIFELTACLSCECSWEEKPRWKKIKIKDDYKFESRINTEDKEGGLYD